MVCLEDVCVPGGLVRGPFGGSLKKSDFIASGYQVYEQRHAIAGTWSGARYCVDAAKFGAMKRFVVRPGDFIVSCSGTIGRIYRVPVRAPRGIINQALLKITVDSDVIDPQFFCAYFQWEKFQSLILESTQGGAMQNLVGMAIFRKSPITLPPMGEQHAIAEALRIADENISVLERIVAKKQAMKAGHDAAARHRQDPRPRIRSTMARGALARCRYYLWWIVRKGQGRLWRRVFQVRYLHGSHGRHAAYGAMPRNGQSANDRDSKLCGTR